MNAKLRDALIKANAKVDRMTAEEVREFLDPVKYGPIALGMNSELIDRALEYKARMYKVVHSCIGDLVPLSSHFTKIFSDNAPTYNLYGECANDPLYEVKTDRPDDASDHYSLAA